MAEWADETDADAYLLNRIGSSAWFATGLGKQPYLTTAYRLLNNDPDYSIPAAPAGATLARLQEAQIEFALHLLSNPNTEKRQNLINQGVTSFSVGQFSESYQPGKGRDVEGYSKYPSVVADLMRPLLAAPSLLTTITRRQEDII